MEYVKYYTSTDAKLTPAFSGFYTKGNSYNPTRNEILSIGIEHVDKKTSLHIKRLRKLYPAYELSDLVSHRVSSFGLKNGENISGINSMEIILLHYIVISLIYR